MNLQKLKVLLSILAAFSLAGCVTAGSAQDPMAEQATMVPATKTGLVLDDLPPPQQKLDVAVYAFPDLTGQNKQGDSFAEFSRAVTQGGAAILVDELTRAGRGRWFDVVERNELTSLLQERQIIQNTRQAALGKRAPGLPPLRFAGIILDGGIVGYDTNESTGGAGARYLGIGGDTNYRRDMVTVSLRAVSVQTGRVLSSVTTTQTLYSIALQGGTFKFVKVDALLELEAGVTRNQPSSLAVREAVQMAVYALIMDGVKNGAWQFSDPSLGAAYLSTFEQNQRAVPVDLAVVAPAPGREVAKAEPSKSSTYIK
jgi:curli production assembly/transport component CsgG